MSRFVFPAHLAMEYHEAGFNVIPCNGKTPVVAWGQWKTERQEKRDVERLFATHLGNAAIVLGMVNPQGLYPYTVEAENRALYDAWAPQADTWRVISPRGGHIHALATHPVAAFKCKDYEIRSEGQLIHVPISRGRRGLPYFNDTSIDKLAIIEAPGFLPMPPARDYTPQPINNGTHKPLTRFALDMLAGRIPASRYESRSEADLALCNSLALCGLEFSEVRELFLRTRHESKYNAMRERRDKYAQHSHASHADEYLLLTYTKALSTREVQDARHALQVADAMEIHADRVRWGRYTTDRLTLQAMAGIVRRTRRTMIMLGQRELAVLAEAGQNTARASLKRHAAAHRIQRERGASMQTLQYADGTRQQMMIPATWAINEQALAAELVDVLQNGATTSTPRRNYCGVFEQAGLGRAARNIYERLSKPMTQAELKDTTGSTQATISKQLATLTRHGLVRKVTAEADTAGDFYGMYDLSGYKNPRGGRPRGSAAQYERTPTPDFEVLAKQLNTAHLGAVRRNIYKRQSEAYQMRLQGRA